MRVARDKADKEEAFLRARNQYMGSPQAEEISNLFVQAAFGPRETPVRDLSDSAETFDPRDWLDAKPKK